MPKTPGAVPPTPAPPRFTVPAASFLRQGSDRLPGRVGLLWNLVGGAWVRGSLGSGRPELGRGQLSFLGPLLFQRLNLRCNVHAAPGAGSGGRGWWTAA